jgi:hypothetical protein
MDHMSTATLADTVCGDCWFQLSTAQHLSGTLGVLGQCIAVTTRT